MAMSSWPRAAASCETQQCRAGQRNEAEVGLGRVEWGGQGPRGANGRIASLQGLLG